MISPIGVYLMRTYADISVPRDLIDAARIDGAGELRIFFRVALFLLLQRYWRGGMLLGSIAN